MKIECWIQLGLGNCFFTETGQVNIKEQNGSELEQRRGRIRPSTNVLKQNTRRKAYPNINNRPEKDKRQPPSQTHPIPNTCFQALGISITNKPPASQPSWSLPSSQVSRSSPEPEHHAEENHKSSPPIIAIITSIINTKLPAHPPTKPYCMSHIHARRNRNLD